MDGHIVVSSPDLFLCFLTILKFFPCLACSFVCSLILRLLSVAVLLSLFHISFSFLSLSFLSPFTSPSCSYASLLHNSNQKHDRSIFFSVLTLPFLRMSHSARDIFGPISSPYSLSFMTDPSQPAKKSENEQQNI
jgi:hypothetical protein